jgi:hypothetical protein
MPRICKCIYRAAEHGAIHTLWLGMGIYNKNFHNNDMGVFDKSKQNYCLISKFADVQLIV